MERRTLALIIGTRPEAIKLAPVFLAAQLSGCFEVRVIVTGQHREMLDQVIRHFELPVHADLQIMRNDQELCATATAALSGLHQVLQTLAPDCVVVQGDTTSTFCGALAAFYLKIPVAHVEAGLRTHNLFSPFPEEANRSLTARLTQFNFAPNERARDNLIAENICPEGIWVTGNTAVDALFLTLAKGGGKEATQRDGRRLLVTAHRRENLGDGLVRICDALLDLLERYQDLRVIYPVHMNPRVRSTVTSKLGSHGRVQLSEPLQYPDFVWAMRQSDVILTDSGGVQEEAPALGKPIVVLREVTERPESIELGLSTLVGTDRELIVAEVTRLFDDQAHYSRRSERRNLYGDGKAAQRIVAILSDKLCSLKGSADQTKLVRREATDR